MITLIMMLTRIVIVTDYSDAASKYNSNYDY